MSAKVCNKHGNMQVYHSMENCPFCEFEKEKQKTEPGNLPAAPDQQSDRQTGASVYFDPMDGS